MLKRRTSSFNMTTQSTRFDVVRFLLSVTFWLITNPCFAELGTDKTEPIKADLKFKHLQLRNNEGAYFVQEITLESGTMVKEYLNASGKVFGVSWQGPFKPDLRLFLGDHALTRLHFENTGKVLDHHHANVNSRDLVIISKGMGRSFAGKAFVPQIAPENVGIDQIQ